MSTDFVAVCDECREEIHLGQRMGSEFSFGYGRNDAVGQSQIAEWCLDHSTHGNGVRVLMAQSELHQKLDAENYTRPAWDE
jgi:hypothetical protein